MLELFTTREISIGIWVIIIIILLLLGKNTRKSLKALVGAALKLWSPFLFILLYAAIITYVIASNELWSNVYIKDVILWVLFVGVPLCFRAVNKNADENYFKEELVKAFKLTALVEFFVNYYTFSLGVELVILPIVSFIVLLDVLAEKEQYKNAKILIDLVITGIGIVLLYQTISSIVFNIHNLKIMNIAITLLLPCVYTCLFIPVAYLLLIVSKYQLIFIRMQRKEKGLDEIIKLKRRIKIILICRLSLRRVEKMRTLANTYFKTNITEEEFDSCLEKVLPGKVEKNNDESNVLKKTEEDTLDCNFIDEVNKNAAGITLLITVSVGIFTVVAKGLYYFYQCGKFDYFGINHIYVNLSSENFLYEFALYAVYMVIYLFLCYLPYIAFEFKLSYIKKITLWLIILVLPVIILYLQLCNVSLAQGGEYTVVFSCVVLIISIVLIGAIYFPGVCLIYTIIPRTNKKKSPYMAQQERMLKPKTLISIVVLSAVYLLGVYFAGNMNSRGVNEFKVFSETEIVIYENETEYVVANYTINEENSITIFANKQSVINKEGVRVEKRIFNNVKISD